MEQHSRRFVIHKHTRIGDIHWDLMIQADDTLWTWRLDREPSEILQWSATAVKIFDHPMKFLDYEGPVNDGAGTVEMVDSGSCQVTAEDGCIDLVLGGNVLAGNFSLRKKDNNLWKFSLTADQA